MRKLTIGLIATLLLCGVLALAFSWQSQHGTRAAATPKKPPAPVTVATASPADVPIILRGLGNVRAYNAVAIHSRVTGNIVRIDFREGQAVKTGDVLFELDPRPFQAALDQANAVLARDEALLNNAQVDLQRYSALLKQNFAPEQQYATQKALVAQYQANIKNDLAQIESAKLNLEFATLRSPVDGITGIRLVDIGNLVQANSTQTLVNVTQIEPIYVQFSLPEQTIPQVRKAMAQGKPEVLAFDGNDQHQLAQGRLDLINNSVDQSTGMITARATYPNKDLALWPGEFVNAHLVLETVHHGVTVPQAAVQTGPDGSFVYVVNDESKADMRPVKVRQVENNIALLSSGVDIGDRVVTLGQSRLEPGARVKIIEEGSTEQIAQQTPKPAATTDPSAAALGSGMK